MTEFLVAVGLAIAALIVGLVVWALSRDYTSNIDRTKFPHWIKSLMRLYLPDSRIVLRHHGSSATIEIVHAGSKNISCDLAIRVSGLPDSEQHSDELRNAVLLDESVSLIDDPRFLLALEAHVSDIWSLSAAAIPAQVINRILDVAGMTPAERFDLKFEGKRSVSGLREWRRKQKAGDFDW